ncbi:MAG: dephospho-CoA kinase, partial [Synechococcaceae bacterium WB9_4xB_025]|nr:dephospho-CoA kinase [Synechococcaceae bacterium WB9_4xB_025]
RSVLERYGDAVRAQGTEFTAAVIDRSALGRIVFLAPPERQWLEQLVHPLVRERFTRELAALSAAPAVVLVIPLLFEAGLDSLCSEAWVVDCDPDQQLQRLMARDHLSAEAAKTRIDAQWPLERKRALADRVLNNQGNLRVLKSQMEQLLNTP